MGYVNAIGDGDDDAKRKAAWKAVADASPGIYGTKDESTDLKKNEAIAKAEYDKIHAKNVGNLIDQQQFNQSYEPKVEISTSAGKSPLPVNLHFGFGEKLMAKVNDVIDKVEAKVQNVAHKIGDGVENIAHNIGEKVHDELQDIGLVKDDVPEAKGTPDAFEQTKQVEVVVTAGKEVSGKGTSADLTGIANVGVKVGAMAMDVGGSHTVGKASDKVDAAYANNGDDDASRNARGIGGAAGGATDNFGSNPGSGGKNSA
jgi:hypothetical protein